MTADWQIKIDPHIVAVLLGFITNLVALSLQAECSSVENSKDVTCKNKATMVRSFKFNLVTFTAFTLDKTEHGMARHVTGAMPSACVYTAMVKVGPKCARN